MLIRPNCCSNHLTLSALLRTFAFVLSMRSCMRPISSKYCNLEGFLVAAIVNICPSSLPNWFPILLCMNLLYNSCCLLLYWDNYAKKSRSLLYRFRTFSVRPVIPSLWCMSSGFRSILSSPFRGKRTSSICSSQPCSLANIPRARWPSFENFEKACNWKMTCSQIRRLRRLKSG